MHELVNFVVNIVWNMGYVGIYIMMTIESSFIPFPSEVAMIPAWYLASVGQMNFYVAFFAWTAWALTWAIINYFLWLKLWWPIIKALIHKYWKYVLLKEDHYMQAEQYFKKHWAITTFLWRFIPAVRQLISVPAWIFKMNFTKFIIYTWIWASIWNLILMTLGYIAWENKELIAQYSKELLFVLLILILLIWFIYYKINKKKEKSKHSKKD